VQFKEYIIIAENKKQAELLVQQGKLSQEDLQTILSVDPTPSKKFTGWMAKQWSSGSVTDVDELRNTIEEFNSFLNKGKTKQKDIYQYKSFTDLKQEVDHLNKTGEGISVKDLEEDYEIVRDDENLLVAVPHTHEASRKLGLSKFAFRECEGGKDSAWCTTYKAPNHFNDYYYKNDVTFYYILVKSKALRESLKKQGYNEPYFVVALAVLSQELSSKAAQKGLPNIDAYDGNDRQFTGEKLQKYLQIIGLR